MGRRSRTRSAIAAPSRKKKKSATSMRAKFTTERSTLRASAVAWPTIWSETQLVARRRRSERSIESWSKRGAERDHQTANREPATLLHRLRNSALLAGTLRPAEG